jgi:site-specific recombinase XerC
MFYKAELQKKNAEKLEEKLKEYGFPEFMSKYFTVKIRSKYGALKYAYVIHKFLVYALKSNLIKRNNISEIIPEDFNDIIAEDIDYYLTKEENSGLSPTTIGIRRNILSSFWGYLSRQKGCEISEKFFKDVTYRGISTKDRSENLVKKFPTKDKLQQMEDKILSSKNEFSRIRNITIFNVLKGTGLRKTELAGLNMNDLYLDEEIPFLKTVGKGKYREMEARRVYLTKSAVDSLKDWLNYRNEISGIIDKDAIFITKDGTRMTEISIDRFFKTYGCGLTPHMFRHWYASIMSKGNLSFAQQQLGHSSPSTIISNYDNGVYGMVDILESM